MNLRYPYLTALAAIIAIAFRYFFPNHESNPLVASQSTLQASLKPAQWIPKIRNLHRYEMDIGNYKISDFKNKENVIGEMTKIIEISKLIPKKVMETNDGYIMEAFYYTPKNAWLDVVTLKIIIDRDTNTIKINGIGESTGFLPLIIPLAPIVNIILCWFPFDDWGNNKRYLKTIQSNIKSKL